MNKLISSLGILLCLVAGQAGAATIHTAACEVSPPPIVNPPPVPNLCVTGVDGVIVNGTTYNVDFVYDTFANLRDAGKLLFYRTYGVGDDVVDAVNLVLNSGTTAQRILASGSSAAFPQYEIATAPTAGGQSTYRGIFSYSALLESPQFVRSTGIVLDNQLAPHAVFTVVPLPAAVWLFGSALAGLGWLRRVRPN